MHNLLTLAHLNGSQKVTKFGFWESQLESSQQRDIGHIFFQPYESKDEFLFCAQHTATPAISLMFGFEIIAAAIKLLSMYCAAALAVDIVTSNNKKLDLSEMHDSDKNTNHVYTVVYCMSQFLLDLLVFPLSAIIMLTRGISTGLKAAEWYDYEAPASKVATGPTA